MKKMKVVEGAYAVAHAAKVCKPHVICAYPITPQTHIAECLSQFKADGELTGESINVESEFAALSCLIGASAIGARTYSATSSQGLAMMHEALFNASGMRFPIVITVVNRAMSAPINIWNDQQDSISQRDTGWIQLYAENVQEAADMTAQAYKIAENKNVLIPAMVCMDGFILSHVFEPVVLLEQDITDEFLPPYDPEYYLDPKNPMTFGALGDPSVYTEYRYLQDKAMENALPVIEKTSMEFNDMYGRYYGGLIDGYRLDNAEIVIAAMGSIIGTLKDTVDELRSEGINAGILKIRSFRPFPKKDVRRIAKSAGIIVAIDKNISLGTGEGALCTEIKACLHSAGIDTPVFGSMLGHGGRDVSKEVIEKLVYRAGDMMKHGLKEENEFTDLRRELL